MSVTASSSVPVDGVRVFMCLPRASLFDADVLSRQLASYRQKGNMVVGLIMMVSMPLLYSSFDDRPASYLPFHPIFPFSILLRYSGPAPDAPVAGIGRTEHQLPAGASFCSSGGMFMLIMISTRVSLQKLFG